MLSNAMQSYSSKYSRDIRHKDYYLFWLENDILLELNDNEAMMNGIQPRLQKAFPNKTNWQINDLLNMNKTESQIKSSIEHLWQFLPNEGKRSISLKHRFT